MKIALLHDTFWPEVGGVEQVMRDQANLLARAGHEVRIISGRGGIPDDGYEVQILPELAPDYPLHVQVRAGLESGQTDQNFAKYRAQLAELLRAALAEMELILVHDHFTLHRNLALTQALHDVAGEHRLIAWTHEIAAGNSDYVLPNAKQAPWSLMRTSLPQVPYVAVSEARGAELQKAMELPYEPQVIPNPVDPLRLFGLTPEIIEILAPYDLPERNFILLLPAPTLPRKNIEFALEIVRSLVALKRNPLLLITAPKDPQAASPDRYGDFLRDSLAQPLGERVVFVGDKLEVTDDALRSLYLVADALLFPSPREGFGLPVIEAALFRLPIWCQDIPAYQAIAEEGAAYPLEEIGRLEGAVEWLESLPTFRQKRLARAMFDPTVIYREYYEPLLAAIRPAEE